MPRWLALGFTGACLLLLAWMTFGMAERPAVFASWMPQVGLNFSIWLDGPALFFAWLVVGIAFLIFHYSGHYMDPNDSPWRFYATMLFFMGSMVGVVVSKNALLMFMFWELTSISSFILIGHWHEKASARAGALRALIVTASGGLCLLAGLAALVWMAKSAGLDPAMVLEWDQLWANREVYLAHPAAGVALVLLLLGAFTKSAQFPFQFWLPGAMEAPTPVSAFLHAATMVKAGIYLLGRLYPMYSDAGMWLWLVGGTGVITMCIGGFMAMCARDIKQLLAHSTVSQLGLLTAYYGFGAHRVGGEHLLPLDLLLVLSHALFKGALFMLCGVIDHGCHTRDWTRLGGLRRTMPRTFVLMAIGCASMAGVPLTFGFVAKELFLKASLSLHAESALLTWGLPALAIFASLFTVAYCLRIVVSPFFGAPRDPEIHPHEGGIGLLAAPAIMIALCLAAGLYVPILEKPLAALTNAEFYGTHSHFTVAFFHGADKLLAIAVFLFAVGAGVFLAGGRILKAYENAGSPMIFRSAYEALFDRAIPAFAAWLARTTQVASLSTNLMRTLLAAFGLVIAAMISSGFALPNIDFEHIPLVGVALSLLMTACLWLVATHRIALVRLIAMAPIGLFVTLLFLIFKAPDLALTQILVEVAMLIVLLLLLFHLPQRLMPPPRPFGRFGKSMRLILSVTGGLLMAVLSHAGFASTFKNIPTFQGEPTVSEYYIQNSKHARYETAAEAEAAGYPAFAPYHHSGGGNNVVNVILVDFRGIDTMGEVTVLGIAGLGVLCLFTLKRKHVRTPEQKAAALLDVMRVNERYDEGAVVAPMPFFARRMWPSPSLIMSEMARVGPPLMLVFAVVLFLKGHGEPGGGFIAGLMASAALATVFISFRRSQIMPMHDFKYRSLLPIGLVFAVGTGLAAVLFGQPFLASVHGYVGLSALGKVELASAMVFDLGVFLVVVGTTLMIIERLGRD
ncbi:MAG: multicomponent antiporter subunit [Candidatus Sumerlaeota bacterium]|nr:multicomponent antiporter subunit [Candidatus Sumerlaeota bacterium]